MKSEVHWVKVEKLPESITLFPVFTGEIVGQNLRVMLDIEKESLYVVIGDNIHQTDISSLVAGLAVKTISDFQIESYVKRLEEEVEELASEPGPNEMEEEGEGEVDV